MTKELTLTGKLFKNYAMELIQKDRFGTNKMIGIPKFWDEYVDQYPEAHPELVKEFEAKQEAKQMVKGSSTIWMVELFAKWDVEDIARRELKAALKFLIDSGYMREWKKRAPFGTDSWFHFYGLTSKGWAIANRYLNA